MINAPVLVTGASGNLGGAVVRSMTAAGRPVRAAGTSVATLQRTFPDIETVSLDFWQPATFAPALQGCAVLFLMRPPRIARVGPTLNALLDQAERTGVEHVVFASVTGADTIPVLPHHRVETHLKASRLSWTILRPGFFSQNLADAYADDIVNDNRLYLPAGQGRVAFVDVRDIGDVVATVLHDVGEHTRKGNNLTGPQAHTFDEVADLLTAELGRPIHYEPATVRGYVTHLRRQGLTPSQVSLRTILHVGLRRGQAETVDPALARLLPRAPRTLPEYVHDHRDRWQPAPA